MTAVSDIHAAINQLSIALDEEHRALVIGDSDAFSAAAEKKILALKAVEDAGDAISESEQHLLQELQDSNRRNGALLAARSRRIRWTLETLGRHAVDAAYNASGTRHAQAITRPWGYV